MLVIKKALPSFLAIVLIMLSSYEARRTLSYRIIQSLIDTIRDKRNVIKSLGGPDEMAWNSKGPISDSLDLLKQVSPKSYSFSRTYDLDENAWTQRVIEVSYPMKAISNSKYILMNIEEESNCQHLGEKGKVKIVHCS